MLSTGINGCFKILKMRLFDKQLNNHILNLGLGVVTSEWYNLKLLM